jgi:hypothetical protein
MSEFIVTVAALLTVVLVMLFASVWTTITMRRDLDQRFDRLRSGLEADATYILRTLLRKTPAKGGSSKPRHSHLRRIK